MNIELLRLMAKAYNTPHLITASALAPILDAIESRKENGLSRLDWGSDDDGYEPETQYKDGVGVLSVDGSLTYKPQMGACGPVGTSYQSLVEQTQEMADAGVRTIVMEVSSGGGEASHCFQLAQEIRNICDEHNIKMIGYADTIACSAAYALISTCDEVIANPSASLGSIGCVVALMDTSKAYEQAGLKRIFITSGANKVPFEADGSFKQSFLDEIQEDVDRLNDEFALFVSANTGIPVDDIKALEAGVFDAAKAVELGLADKTMTNKEFAAYVASLHTGINIP